MNSKLKDENIDYLFSAIMQLKSIEECYDFFDDLCTVPELKAMAQRIVVARMLKDNMVKATGASTATISRVNRSLHYGCQGYDIAFDRLAGKK